MKIFNKSAIFSAAVAASILSFGGTVVEIKAQSNINDDLQPTKTTKNKTAARSKPVNKPAKKVEISDYRKPSTPPAPVRPPESASDVIARYMNLQQSASVSNADWDNVVKQSNSTLLISPNDKTAKTQLAIAQGQLAFNRGDYSNALTHFNAAAQLMPESALPFYGIGKVYSNTKQPDEAEKSFEKAIKLNRNFALAYKGFGDVLTSQGKTKKAQEYYKQAAQFGAGGQPANGSGNYQANAARTPNNATTQPVAESPYERDLKAAHALTAQRKWNEALVKLQPLASANPNADVYILMGDNYYGMKSWISAQQAYRKAAELNPNSAVAFYKSGQVLFETNEYQSAAEAFEKSLILDQNGSTINRAEARRMADKSSERARNGGKDKKKFLIL